MCKNENRNIQIKKLSEKISRRANENGAITPLSVVLILCLLVMGGLFIDLAIANAKSQHQSNMLANARNNMMSTPESLQIKNADNPGFYAAKEIMISLRNNGYDGKIWVYYLEAPLKSATSSIDSVPYEKRAFAWGVQTEEDVPTLLLRFTGVDEMPVWSTVVSSAMPYSGTKTWRPDVAGAGGEAGSADYLRTKINGVYTLKAGIDVNNSMREDTLKGQIKYTPLQSTDDFPEKIQVEFRKKVEEANKTGE